MKKIFSYAASAFAAFALASCMGSEDIVSNQVSGEVVDADVQVGICVKGDAGSRVTGTPEHSGIEENLYAPEYEVKTARLYFIAADGNIAMAKDYNFAPVAGSYDKYQATDKSKQYIEGTYNVYAIANPINMPQVGTLNELLAAVDAKTYAEAKIKAVPSTGFIMTNRGNSYATVSIKKNTKTTINLDVERVVAKIRVKYGNDTKSWDLKAPGSDVVYASVTVNSQSYVNLATDFYAYRHTCVLPWAETTPASATFAYGDIAATNGYAVDPHFFQKRVLSADERPAAAPAWLKFPYDVTANAPADADSIYCLPNTMFAPAQQNYYTTGIMINATLVPTAVLNEEGEAVQNAVQNIYYFNYKFYTSLDAAKKAGGAPSKATEENIQDYNIIKFSNNGAAANTYTTRYWYWIRHYDNDVPGDLGVMEFGIVRNNIYDINISSILGPGNPEPPTPPTPDDYNYEIEVNLGVKPWIVRPQSGILE